jgi:hypothetical protein
LQFFLLTRLARFCLGESSLLVEVSFVTSDISPSICKIDVGSLKKQENREKNIKDFMFTLN